MLGAHGGGQRGVQGGTCRDQVNLHVELLAVSRLGKVLVVAVVA
jgi:hypothetical protein